MKPNEYKVLEIAVEEGVTYGFQRAFKHNDKPSDQLIVNSIKEQVMNSLYEWFVFEGGNATD